MNRPPHDRVLDSSLAFLREGYDYVGNRCRRLGADVVQTRLLGRRTVLVRGASAAFDFYNAAGLVRAGAAPRRMRRTLIGDRGVQSLDGDAHRQRKALFLGMLDEAHARSLTEHLTTLWRERLDEWEASGRIVLQDEAGLLLTRAACDWAGIPLADDAVAELHHDLRAMIESGATVGPDHWRGRAARRRREAWAAGLIRDVRRFRLAPPRGTALHTLAWAREKGRPLPLAVAAVELLNLVRPTVAVERFIAVAAHALHLHPGVRGTLGTEVGVECFVSEVRRFYPFFPAAVARVAEATSLGGHEVKAGGRVLLDLYGTDMDPSVWTDPAVFDPARFLVWSGDAYAFVPQGGGDPAETHRCAGERVTVLILQAVVRLLAREMTYDVPPQDLSVPMSLVPGGPRSGMVLSDVRRVVDLTAHDGDHVRVDLPEPSRARASAE